MPLRKLLAIAVKLRPNNLRKVGKIYDQALTWYESFLGFFLLTDMFE